MDEPDFKWDGSMNELDFRVRGHERFADLASEGTPSRYDALCHDIVPGSRIVDSYGMCTGMTGCRCR